MSQALTYYLKTDELEPKGFFTSKTAIYALQGEQSGKFSKGLYMAYLSIEWEHNQQRKLEIAKLITQKAPTFAPAWKALSSLLSTPAERMGAIEKGLQLDPDADTKGNLLINKALILQQQGNKQDAKTILEDLIQSPETTTANVAIAKVCIKQS